MPARLPAPYVLARYASVMLESSCEHMVTPLYHAYVGHVQAHSIEYCITVTDACFIDGLLLAQLNTCLWTLYCSKTVTLEQRTWFLRRLRVSA